MGWGAISKGGWTRSHQIPTNVHPYVHPVESPVCWLPAGEHPVWPQVSTTLKDGRRGIGGEPKRSDTPPTIPPMAPYTPTILPAYVDIYVHIYA